MNKPIAVYGVGLVFALTIATTLVSAECFSVPPCEELGQASVVFVADVVEAGEPAESISPTQSRAVPQPVRFRIIERFKGIGVDEREIAARIAFSSAETVFVRAGTRYLVYARTRPDGTWSTSCSSTKPVDHAEEDLTQLRQCPRR
jgi:hypothetical protein